MNAQPDTVFGKQMLVLYIRLILSVFFEETIQTKNE